MFMRRNIFPMRLDEDVIDDRMEAQNILLLDDFRRVMVGPSLKY